MVFGIGTFLVLHRPADSVPRVRAGDADSDRGAALAVRRAAAAAAHRHRPERLVGDGADSAVGLVVKNGIMLLDFSEQLHEEGESFEAAIAHAGRIRLRPILMTTFCTLFGLLPLALGLGAGAELQKPLALAVIGGLALSTPVTLLVVPGLYAAIKRRSADRRR